MIQNVGIAADHGGFELKEHIKALMGESGLSVKDYGAFKLDPQDDYPDMVTLLAKAISEGNIHKGIAICGSGVGASIVANKMVGVRAALVTETYSAHQGVEHDDMNMLCLGGRVVGTLLAWELIQAYLRASYVGGGRFERRLQKLIALEQENFKKT